MLNKRKDEKSWKKEWHADKVETTVYLWQTAILNSVDVPPRVLLFFKDLITRYGITQLRFIIYYNFDVSPRLKTLNREEEWLKLSDTLEQVSISQINYPQNAIDILTTLRKCKYYIWHPPFVIHVYRWVVRKSRALRVTGRLVFQVGLGKDPFCPTKNTILLSPCTISLYQTWQLHPAFSSLPYHVNCTWGLYYLN